MDGIGDTLMLVNSQRQNKQCGVCDQLLVADNRLTYASPFVAPINRCLKHGFIYQWRNNDLDQRIA